jgi:hypothetical protein
VRKNSEPHTCSSERRSKVVKQATKFWVCDVAKDWLTADSRLGAQEIQAKIKEKYKIEVPYKRVYYGKELAHSELFGDWDSSFDNLYTLKAEVKNACPGSVVVIKHHKTCSCRKFKEKTKSVCKGKQWLQVCCESTRENMLLKEISSLMHSLQTCYCIYH